MNQELENYMMFEMMKDRYASETFEKAEKIYCDRLDWDNFSWFESLKIRWKINNIRSNEFREIKRIQAGLLQVIVDEAILKDSHSKSSTSSK